MNQLRTMMVLAALCVAVGCERERESVGEEMRGQADDLGENEQVSSPQTASAIQAITTARCEREQRCGNVGGGEQYASADDCVARTRSDWQDDLNAYECTEGVVQDELAECVQEIRAEDCGNPFDSLERIGACRSSDICNS